MTTTAESSRELVERFQSGDVDAFAEIYRRNHDVVFRFLHFRLRNRDLAEDLTHDVFVKAMRGLETWQWQGRDVGAFLVTVARNLMIDYIKSGRNQREISAGDHLDLGADRRDGHREGDPEGAVIERLRDTALLKALWELTEDQRTCLVHRFVQGLTIAETAEAMGKDEGAIKAAQYRATQALAARLGEGPW